MPSRCPRPQGTRPSSARTPSPTRSRMRGLERALGGAAIVERARTGLPPARVGSDMSNPCWPSLGIPSPSTIRPSRPSPTAMRNGAPLASTRVPGPMPCSSPSGISSVRPSLKPTTSADTAARLRSVPTRHTSPTSACTPVASMISPIRLLTKPWRRARSASRMASVARPSSAPGGAGGTESLMRPPRRSQALCSTTSRARSNCVCTLASTSPSAVRTIALPTPDALVGLHVAELDAAPLRRQLADRRSAPPPGRRG